MMDEEIKALIEREAIKEAAYNPNDPRYDDNWINKELHVGAYDGFKLGANFALSLFRWRKVGEELPKIETVLIKVMCHYPNGNHEIKYTTGTISSKDKCNLDYELIKDITRSYKAIEWMPIPNN